MVYMSHAASHGGTRLHAGLQLLRESTGGLVRHSGPHMRAPEPAQPDNDESRLPLVGVDAGTHTEPSDVSMEIVPLFP